MIDVEGLVFDYPSGRALDRVSFVVRPGAIVALIGPEGAGKSTLMRCMAALEGPGEGRVSVLGLDTLRHPRAVHAALGFVPDTFGLYDELSVRRCLTYSARSRGVAEAEAPDAVATTAEAVGLGERLETLAGDLSRGLRQRLAIGQAVVHRPRVLLLDEPMARLDPLSRDALGGLIARFAEQGMTVVVSSLLLSDVEDVCSEALVLEDGQVVGDGVMRLADLRTRDARLLRLRLELTDPLPGLAEALAALGLDVEHAELTVAVIRLAGEPSAEAQALARIVGAGLPVRSFTREPAVSKQGCAAQPDPHPQTAMAETLSP